MFTRTSYIATLPASVQQGIRKAVSRNLSEVDTWVQTDYMARPAIYSSLPSKVKSEVLDDLMSGRLSDLEGIDTAYWITRANSIAKGRR